MKFLLFILVIIGYLNVALANNDNCGLNDLNALMVRLRQLRTEFIALKTQHEATQAEIKVLKEENRNQETELEELRQDVNNNSTEIAEISKVIEIIKDIDDCSPNQCQNEATCVDGVTSYTCSCVAGYNGTLCEIDIDDCNPNPCQNGAKCTDGVDSYTCTCVAGYTGTNCETDIDDCNPDPCQNGATCTDGVDSYTCTCVAGYTGTNCETDIDDCNPNPCQNGATCTDGVDSYTCMCVAGYTGTNCETDIDNCNPNPCQSRETCTDGVDSYTCTCVAGYTGTNCETAKCPADWYFFQESCYFNSTKGLNWLEAEHHCIDLGGHLVEITSEQENDFITSITSYKQYYAWIGLNDRVTEGVFVWVSSGNNASGVYTKWAPGETNNSGENCVLMEYSKGDWYSHFCSSSTVFHYICEKASLLV